jgi:hypothetical protein
MSGAFLHAFLGDFLVLLAVLWHTHVLKVSRQFKDGQDIYISIS